MAKARSPVLGYNHNVRFHGRIFHIQTEDSGVGNPHIFTHLFYEGTILASKKAVYDVELAESDVKGLMQVQHKAMMKDLKQGSCDDRIGAFFAARGEPMSLVDAPETAAPEAGPGAGLARALDLDAVAAAAAREQTPEPTPVAPPVDTADAVPIPMAAELSPALASGAGLYGSRGGARDRPFDPQTPAPALPADAAPAPQAPLPRPKRPSGVHDAPPDYAEISYGAVPTAAQPAPTQPLVARATGVAQPPVGVTAPRVAVGGTSGAVPGRPRPRSSSAPVLILQPARKPAPRLAPAAAEGGVVVQRQVIVGVGGSSPPVAQPTRPQRPVKPIPYVIAGGPRPGVPRPSASNPPSAPPAAAAAPAPAPVGAQPTAPAPAPQPSTEPPSAFAGELDSDRSLDDVILAYLAEDSGGIPIK